MVNKIYSSANLLFVFLSISLCFCSKTLSPPSEINAKKVYEKLLHIKNQEMVSNKREYEINRDEFRRLQKEHIELIEIAIKTAGDPVAGEHITKLAKQLYDEKSKLRLIISPIGEGSTLVKFRKTNGQWGKSEKGVETYKFYYEAVLKAEDYIINADIVKNTKELIYNKKQLYIETGAIEFQATEKGWIGPDGELYES